MADTLAVYPHSLAYFNQSAGGPINGHQHLIHSNLDWGQDLWLVQDWMESEGISPTSVRLRPGHACPMRPIMLGESQPHRLYAWEVLSADTVARRVSDGWQPEMHPGVQRIGFTMWAVPVAEYENELREQQYREGGQAEGL